MPVELKDSWDKFEILSKFLGASIIPIAVAASVFIWNDQRTKGEVALMKLRVAVDVLSAKPIENNKDNKNIRRWAAGVLSDPTQQSTTNSEFTQAVISSGFLAEVIYEAAFCDLEEKRYFSQAELDWRAQNAPENLRLDYKTNLAIERECEN